MTATACALSRYVTTLSVFLAESAPAKSRLPT